MRRVLIGLMVAVVASCSGRPSTTPSAIPSRLLGTPPRLVGSDLYLCPGGWAGYRALVYAPNDSTKPSAEIRPDRCFGSLEEAMQAGFHLPAPPPGGLLIDALYLVLPDPPILPVCQEAARRLGFRVLCPTLIPGAADSMVACGKEGCIYYGALVLHFSFAGPPGYVGIPGQNGNHLFVLESRAGRESQVEFLTCMDGEVVGHTTVLGTVGQWIDCPGGSSMNSGHVVLVWTHEGIRYAVSLHADTELNREVALAVADRLVPVTG